MRFVHIDCHNSWSNGPILMTFFYQNRCQLCNRFKKNWLTFLENMLKERRLISKGVFQCWLLLLKSSRFQRNRKRTFFLWHCVMIGDRCGETALKSSVRWTLEPIRVRRPVKLRIFVCVPGSLVPWHSCCWKLWNYSKSTDHTQYHLSFTEIEFV